MRRIITHKRPDADALVSAWLAEHYLFAGEEVQVVFMPRDYRLDRKAAEDCVVDLANTHDPSQLAFDHKKPAFADRNQTCATRLVWDHLIALGMPVQHLASLVDVVHEGDRSPPRKGSVALRQSRTNGLHARIAHLRSLGKEDEELYAGMRKWLATYDAQAKLQQAGTSRGRGLRHRASIPRLSCS